VKFLQQKNRANRFENPLKNTVINGA